MAVRGEINLSCGHTVARVRVPTARGARYWCEACGEIRMSGNVAPHATEWVFLLRDLIAQNTEPIVVDDPGSRHGRALLAALGVKVEVRTVSTLAQNGLVTYCPYGVSCGWSFVGSKTRAEGYLAVHLRVLHKSVDPRKASVLSEREPLGHVTPVEPIVAAPGSSSSASPSPQVGTGEAGSRSESTAPPTERETVATRKRWSREEILDAIKAHAAANGGVPPTIKDWAKGTDDHPTWGQVNYEFGKWSVAIVEAGFAPSKPGGVGGARAGRSSARSTPAPLPAPPTREPVEAPPEPKTNGNAVLALLARLPVSQLQAVLDEIEGELLTVRARTGELEHEAAQLQQAIGERAH